jgi:hypothetical protein
LQDYTFAIRVRPDFDTALFARGVTWFLKGELPQAEEDLAEANRIRPHMNKSLWLFLVRARAGKNPSAALSEAQAALPVGKWPASAAALFLGKSSPSAVLTEAGDTDPTISRQQTCDARIYIAAWRILRKESAMARDLLAGVARDCDARHQALATVELKRLK